MADQRIHPNLGTFDTLTKEELSSSLWDHQQHVEMSRLAGMKAIRFPLVTLTGTGAGTLALVQPANGGAPVGPDQGFIWEIQRVTVASNIISDQAAYGIYVGSDATFNPAHLFDNGVASVPPVTSPAVPASGVNVQNPFGVPVSVNIQGGAVTAVSVNGNQVLAGDGVAVIPVGGVIQLTYTVAPTWTFSGIGTKPSGGVSVNTAWYPSKHSAWVFPGEQVMAAVYGTSSNNQYTMTGLALEVPMEMQGKIM